MTASGAGQLVAVVAAVVLAKTEPEDGGARAWLQLRWSLLWCRRSLSGWREDGHDGCGCFACECEQLGVVYRFNISARVIKLCVLGSPAVPIVDDTVRDGCWCGDGEEGEK